MLQVRGLSKKFGGLAALSDVDLEIEKGEMFGLIGPNGAGKTTFFNVVTGTYKPTHGRVLFMGREITGKKPHVIAHMGIGRVFQSNVLFRGMTVFDQLLIGCHRIQTTGVLASFVGTRASRREESEIRIRALEVLDFVGLTHAKDELVSNLSHGHQRAVSIASALISKPKLLLLDEPVTGMNEAERKGMLDKIRDVNSQGVTIIMIEHDMKAVMSLCRRIAVLNYGAKIAEGTPEEVAHNEAVIDAYLGTGGEYDDLAQR